MLADAAALLVMEAHELDADRLFRRARELRDEIDEAGLADREEARRQARSFRFRRLPDGMSRVTWDLDPESAASVADLYDRATSPKRGGPRFVAGDNEDQARRIMEDTRTTEQLESGVFLHLLSAGAAADSSELLATGGAVISVLVTQKALHERHGLAHIAGQSEPVSIRTAERLCCGGASMEITFGSDGSPLDVGREQRRFTAKQRKALAARDGGCMAPDGDRPASWTEAHHIKFWHRDHGATNIADGVLLCRHHHLVFHNNGWEIEREGTTYWLVPPPSVDPDQKRVWLRSKSPAMRELRRELEHEVQSELERQAQGELKPEFQRELVR